MMNKYRKKMISYSIALILVGVVISIIGFGISGFNLDTFKSLDSEKWYRTINIDIS